MRFRMLILLIILSSCLQAQNFFIDAGVDTLDQAVKSALAFYKSYLSGFKGDATPNYSNYWSKEDCNLYTVPDPAVYAIAGDYPTYSMGYNRTVFYVKPTPQYVLIKTLYSWADTAGNISILCITDHYVYTADNGSRYFISPVNIEGATWQTKKAGHITYTFPPYHSFNQQAADSLSQSIQKLCSEWDAKPLDIHYYFAKTKDEIQKLRGFDFTLDMGNRDKPSGMACKDNIIYCAGLDENYFHEIVHLYLSPLFPRSPLKEGIAVFYGGSMGHNLTWHLQRMREYLNQHPETDLGKPKSFTYIDNTTNPGSTIQGLLCLLAWKKDGIQGLKRIMAYTSLSEIYSREFNVKPEEVNSFLRKAINAQ